MITLPGSILAIVMLIESAKWPNFHFFDGKNNMKPHDSILYKYAYHCLY